MDQILFNFGLLVEYPIVNLKIVIDGVMIGALFALAAYGLALVWGVMNVKNLAQGDFVIAGGYVSWWLVQQQLRDRLRAAAPGLRFVHLHGYRALISDRMAAREDHFMPLSLLDDQLSMLEPLDDDEAAVVVRIDQPVDAIVDEAAARLG